MKNVIRFKNVAKIQNSNRLCFYFFEIQGITINTVK